jgi:uncharacterized membrane-anchored protein
MHISAGQRLKMVQYRRWGKRDKSRRSSPWAVVVTVQATVYVTVDVKLFMSFLQPVNNTVMPIKLNSVA